jgi:hypothetical protein
MQQCNIAVLHEFTDDTDKCRDGCISTVMLAGATPKKCWYPPRHVKFDGINALMPHDPDCVMDSSSKYNPAGKKDKSWRLSNGFYSVPDASLKPYPPEEW